jgi:hypothetical protein
MAPTYSTLLREFDEEDLFSYKSYIVYDLRIGCGVDLIGGILK